MDLIQAIARVRTVIGFVGILALLFQTFFTIEDICAVAWTGSKMIWVQISLDRL